MGNLDGQYMASRISRLINKQTEKLKVLLNNYNKLVGADDCITWEDVTNLESSFWLQDDNLQSVVPKSIRLQAINLLSKFHRALEEMHLLDEEMINVLIHHSQDHAALTNTIRSLECSATQFDRGCLCLLNLRLLDCIKEIDSFSKSQSSILTNVCNNYLEEEKADVLLNICKSGDHNQGSCCNHSIENLESHNNHGEGLGRVMIARTHTCTHIHTHLDKLFIIQQRWRLQTKVVRDQLQCVEVIGEKD